MLYVIGMQPDDSQKWLVKRGTGWRGQMSQRRDTGELEERRRRARGEAQASHHAKHSAKQQEQRQASNPQLLLLPGAPTSSVPASRLLAWCAFKKSSKRSTMYLLDGNT